MADYKWTYASIGGATRVKIQSGEDIRHLGELDEKMWTVLSCPTVGLEIDETSLKLIDTDGDGKADYSGFIVATSGSSFTTLEGSVTDNVRKTTYTTNNAKIVGYGVPDYAMLLLAKADEERESN